jgi:hypothetical protein
MYYKFTLEELDHDWAFVMTFDKNTPTTIKQANEYADEHLNAEDTHGIRHYVLLKGKRIIQIQLHQALKILPHLNPNDPSSIRMPAIQAIKFGNPPVPSLLIVFKEFNPQKLTAYGLSPNVFLVFDEAVLARLYITDVYSVMTNVG